MFYDGQGFLVWKRLGVASTTTEQNLHEFSRKHGLGINVVAFDRIAEALAHYESGQCDGLTNDHSVLSVLR